MHVSSGLSSLSSSKANGASDTHSGMIRGIVGNNVVIAIGVIASFMSFIGRAWTARQVMLETLTRWVLRRRKLDARNVILCARLGNQNV